MSDPSTTNNADSAAEHDPLQVVFGGKEIPIKFLTGEESMARVSYLAVTRYPEFALVLNDEARQVEMFCRQKQGWGARLHPESHDAIMVIGHELNLPFFERWAARRSVAQQAIDPGLQSRMERAARDMMRELIAPHVETTLGLSPLPGSATASPITTANP